MQFFFKFVLLTHLVPKDASHGSEMLGSSAQKTWSPENLEHNNIQPVATFCPIIHEHFLLISLNGLNLSFEDEFNY